MNRAKGVSAGRDRVLVERPPAARLLLGLVWLLGGFTVALSQEQPRAGRVEFSDGTVLAGRISLTPGSELKLHIGNQLRTLALDRVQEMQFSSEKESLEQGYRFIEAGKAIKENQGQPYPVRFLQTKIVLAGGETITGHLYTTVLYVQGEENAQKVVLLAKQRGKEGEALSSLVYPARISFGEPAKAEQATIRLRVNLPLVGPATKVAALARGTLARLEVKPTGRSGVYSLSSPLGKGLFLAVETGAKLVVGWPRQSDAKLTELIRRALPNAEDFFDERRLLGVFREEGSAEVYSLMLVSRKGQTTLEQDRSQPWRLEVYRWKLDDDGQRLMLGGHDYFFRGLETKNQAPPTVELSDKLWQVRQAGDTWVAGGE